MYDKLLKRKANQTTHSLTWLQIFYLADTVTSCQTGQDKQSWNKTAVSKSNKGQVQRAHIQWTWPPLIKWLVQLLHQKKSIVLTYVQVQAFILTWVHHYWCTPKAYLLRDQQTSPLFLRRSLLTGNPPHRLGYRGVLKWNVSTHGSTTLQCKQPIASANFNRKPTATFIYLLSFSWQRMIATPVKTLCSLPLKLKQEKGS